MARVEVVTEKVLKKFLRAKKMFTALDISEAVKKIEFHRHRSVSNYLKGWFASGILFPSNYDYTDIHVKTKKGYTYARLYHENGADVSQYTDRDQNASAPVRKTASRSSLINSTPHPTVSQTVTKAPDKVRDYTVASDGRVRIGIPMKSSAKIRTNRVRVYSGNGSLNIVKTTSDVKDGKKYEVLTIKKSYIELPKRILKSIASPGEKITAEVRGKSIKVYAT